MKEYKEYTRLYYTGIKGFYFRKLLRTIIDVGDLQNCRVLDFGCGSQQLKRFLHHKNYIGYDIRPDLTDVTSLDGVPYDVMVVNEVFYEMPEADIVHALETIRPTDLVVGISLQNILNKVGAALLSPGAHINTLTSPEKELEILLRYYRIVKKKNVWWLADVYLLKRK